MQEAGQEEVQEVQVGRQVITWSASQLKKNGRLNLVEENPSFIDLWVFYGGFYGV